MSCQAIARSDEARERLTERRITVTRRQIHRIERAKTLVCGVPSAEAIAEVRNGFETLLPLLAEGVRVLNSGALDNATDEQLRELAAGLQDRDSKMAYILDASQKIGLPALEPFPHLLAEFQRYKEHFQSQLEGIMLSLNAPFQDLLSKSASELSVPV